MDASSTLANRHLPSATNAARSVIVSGGGPSYWAMPVSNGIFRTAPVIASLGIHDTVVTELEWRIVASVREQPVRQQPAEL